MDGNNSFLDSYKKKLDDQKNSQGQEAAVSNTEPPSLRFEEKSGFVKPQRKDNPIRPASSRPNRLLVPIVLGAVLVLGIAIALLLFLNRGIEVIDLTNWAVNDVQLWASDNKLKLQVDEQYNDMVGEGRIISQSPAKGERVSKGGFVQITISLGHDLTVELPLPDLMSMTKDGIEAWAAENYMTKVRITAEFSENTPSGNVISYEINDNTVVDMVKRNTPIYVIVSKGTDETAVQITVPNFKEKTIQQSYEFANENGILLAVEEQYDNFAPKGSIIAQSVKADEKVKKGDGITLTLSKGKMITIPSFEGDSKQKAAAVAADLGIPVAILEKYSSAASGEFISQSIAAGSVYEDGDILELQYSLGNKIVLSSFVGQTRDAIENWAKDLNEQGAQITIKASSTQSNAPKGSIIYQDKSNTVIGVKTTISITVSLGKAVFVPDFVAPDGSGYDTAMTREKALALCEALNLVPVFVAEKKTGRLPGEIWYQSIAAGTEKTEGAKITLKYNPANVQITVPSFVGMTHADIIAGGFYQMLDITIVISDEAVDGYVNTVHQQSIREGTQVAAGSAITLHISPAP